MPPTTRVRPPTTREERENLPFTARIAVKEKIGRGALQS